MSSISLLLKLAAASLFGTAALLSRRKLLRDVSLFFQRRDILRRTASMTSSNSPPPTILVVGFRSHGKSAFINTACRVLSGEDGPLLLRSETAPAGNPPGAPVTRSERAVKVAAAGWWWEESEVEEVVVVEEGEEVVVVEMVDTPGFAVPAVGNVKEEVEEVMKKKRTVGAAECVVVVMRCPGVDVKKKMGSLKKLAEITDVVREHGLNVVVVLTNKHAMKNARQVEELRKEAVAMARTDCVYIIENYTMDTGRPFSPTNNFETHFSVLAIVRQCMEYSKVYRSHRQQKEKNNMSLPVK